MPDNPKKEKIVNTDSQPVTNPANEPAPAKDIAENPLAPFDPRLKKPGEGPLQANEDPLNGINE